MTVALQTSRVFEPYHRWLVMNSMRELLVHAFPRLLPQLEPEESSERA